MGWVVRMQVAILAMSSKFRRCPNRQHVEELPELIAAKRFVFQKDPEQWDSDLSNQISFIEAQQRVCTPSPGK
jgi:hypothetical protein